MKDLKALLLNPFPHRISPYADLLREKSDQWINEEYRSLPFPFRQMLGKLNPGYWVANCWPDASFPLLNTLTRFVLWGIAFDDYCTPLHINKLSKITHRMLEIVKGARTEPTENLFFQQCAIFSREFESFGTNDWNKRIMYDMSLFFEGVEIDSTMSYREDVKYPSVKDYIPIRRKAMGADAICSSIELITGILPDHVVANPFIQKTRALSSDLMGWGNDLISFEKEQEQNEALNLVLVIKNERKCSMDDAFYEAVRMYNSRMEEYLVLYNDIPDFGALTPNIRKLMDALGVWISGQINWFDYTNRYRAFTGMVG